MAKNAKNQTPEFGSIEDMTTPEIMEVHATLLVYYPPNGDREHYTLTVQITGGHIDIFGYHKDHMDLYSIALFRKNPKWDGINHNEKYEHIWAHYNAGRITTGDAEHRRVLNGLLRNFFVLNKTDGDRFDAARTIWDNLRE